MAYLTSCASSWREVRALAPRAPRRTNPHRRTPEPSHPREIHAHTWRADARRPTAGLAVPFAATIKQQPDELAAAAAAVRECGVVVRAVLVGCETGAPPGV